MDDTEKTKQKVTSLELGQIIRIVASSNPKINEKIYQIYYLDEQIIKLITDELEEHELRLKNGLLTDESIESVQILYNPELKGYAKQNNLFVNKWISIQFGGDVPMFLNGQITNLEEDMIEITGYDDKEKYYIDFEYKGLPLDLNILSINDFIPPEQEQKLDDIEEAPEEEEIKEMDEFEDIDEDEYDDEKFVEEEIEVDYNEAIIDADKLIFGDKLDMVFEVVEVEEKDKIYSIKQQTNDLLDDLLSVIPGNERTRKVLNDINIMIERYSELREIYSTFNEKGTLSNIKYKDNNHKPLVESMKTLNDKLYWIMPTVKVKHRLFDINNKGLENVELTDTYDYINNIHEVYKQYHENTIPSEQNAYMYLNQRTDVNNLLDIENKNDIIIDLRVGSKTLGLVDNFDNFSTYSTKDKKEPTLTRCQYKTQSYSLGLNTTYFEATDKQKKPIFKEMTKNDKIYINGFITLPYPVYNYSNISLSTSKLGDKVNYNMTPFNYFTYLKNSSTWEIKNINLTEKQKDNINFNNITHYKLDINLNYDDRNLNDEYDRFLNTIIPSTKTAFNKIKKFIKNGTSFDSVIEHLNPLLINKEDILYNNYKEIVEFIQEQNSTYIKNSVKNVIEYSEYIKKRINYSNKSLLFELFKLDKLEEVKNIDVSLYDLEEQNSVEYLNQVFHLDNGRTLLNALALNDFELNQPIDIKNKMEDTLEQLKNTNKEDNKCKTEFVLAKKYYDVDDLNNDNNKNIIFDPKLDDTRYDILTDLQKQFPNLTREKLIDHLMKNVGLDNKKARRDAKAMMEGKKDVDEGDYAVLDDGSYMNKYYKRQSNKWLLQKDLNGKSIEEIEFCNTKKHCLKINEECLDETASKGELQKRLVKDVLQHFEDEIVEKGEQLKSKIVSNFDYNINNLLLLKKFDEKNKMRYDSIKVKLGESLDVLEIEKSPHQDLRDKILSIDDIIKRSEYTILFVRKYCRKSINCEEENTWYYCNKTSVPLLPTFFYDLAVGIKENNYDEVLDRVCNERGVISDDGDKIVDKHSGYFIKMLNFDTAEGYNQDGFKIVSRGVLDDDKDMMEEKEKEEITETVEIKKPQVKRTNLSMGFLKIFKSLDDKFKIDTSEQHDLMISKAIKILTKNVKNKEAYDKLSKEQIKKGKKPKKYTDYFDQIQMFAVICLYIVGIQLNKPHIYDAPTFFGCGPVSFKGYPLENGTNYDIFRYVVCVFLRMRDEVRPWKVLPKTNSKNFNTTRDKLMEITIAWMNNNVLTDSDIMMMIKEKRYWLKENKIEDVMREDYDLKRWDTFLPPLIDFDITKQSGIGMNFEKLLKDAMIKGDLGGQYGNILELKSRIVNMSLMVQKDIQKVINKQPLLLNTMNNIPFLENACCYGENNAYKYFVDKNGMIETHNENVLKMSNIHDWFNSVSKAPFFRNTENTKIPRTIVSKQYSETTIYKSFIKYCKYNSGLILDDEMARLCLNNNSNYNENDSIEEKINIMKSEGHNYSNASLKELIKLISKKNIISKSITNNIVSQLVTLKKQLEYINIDNKSNINEKYLKGINILIDSFKLDYDEKVDGDVNIVLANIEDMIDEMKDDIIELLKKSGRTKNHIEFINNIDKFTNRCDMCLSDFDITNYFSSNFIKNNIKNIIKDFPNIIINKVNYKEVNIPKHWKITQFHQKDVQNMISSELDELSRWYDNKNLEDILKEVMKVNVDLLELSKKIPLIAKKKINNKYQESVLNGKIINLLNKYLFIKSLHNYINVTEDMKFNFEDEGRLEGDLEDELLEGKKEEMLGLIGKLMVIYLNIFMKNKKLINYSREEIKERVLKIKEKEKREIAIRLKELSKEQRGVENLMKEHRLGDWGLGQKKALFEYDEFQYDKEREKMDTEMLNDLKLGKNSDLDDVDREMFKEMFMMKMQEEERYDSNMINRNMSLSNLPEDDDYGDNDDGDNHGDYD